MLRASIVSLALLAFVPSAFAQRSESRFHEARVERFYLDEVDVAIARASHEDAVLRLPPVERDAPWSGTAEMSTVFMRFFGNIAPNQSGVERPAPDDHPIEEYEVDLGNHVSYVLLGSANYHVLTPLHFYQQLDGIHALRYDVLPHDAGNPIRVAVAASPAYGSITTITRHMGVQADEQLPLSVVVGGAAGIDAWYDGRVIGVHARAWAMPGADVVNGGTFGVSTLESIQVKWHASETLGGDPAWPIDFGVLGMHLDRGDQRGAVYGWNGDFRSAAELRELWQVTGFVELRVD
jgi:hypothetical protein